MIDLTDKAIDLEISYFIVLRMTVFDDVDNHILEADCGFWRRESDESFTHN